MLSGINVGPKQTSPYIYNFLIYIYIYIYIHPISHIVHLVCIKPYIDAVDN